MDSKQFAGQFCHHRSSGLTQRRIEFAVSAESESSADAPAASAFVAAVAAEFADDAAAASADERETSIFSLFFP